MSGERAHYELEAGNLRTAGDLLQSMELSPNGSRLLPEQVWDAADIPERELFFGKPSGGACPLVWEHSEYLKLVRSLHDGKIFDQHRQTVNRYRVEQRRPIYWNWRFNNNCRSMPLGKNLRIEVRCSALAHWSDDQWHSTHGVKTRDSGLGMHFAALATSHLEGGRQLVFTLFWLQVEEGTDFSVTIEFRRP
jgi:glucoamylase